MKKILASLLIVTILCMGFATTVFAATTHEVSPMEKALIELAGEYYGMADGGLEKDIIRNTVELYMQDDMFAAHFAETPDEAIDMVRTVIESDLEMAINPNWVDGTLYGVSNVPVYAQKLTYSCGAASALQVITSLGGSVTGSTMSAKEDHLISDISLGTGGALVYQVANLINDHTDATYAYKEITSSVTKAQFAQLVTSSLAKDGAVILHSIPKYLTSYYPSTATTGHYIVGETYISASPVTPTVAFMGLNDCHYNASYNGRHTVTEQEAYNSVSARYLIYRTS